MKPIEAACYSLLASAFILGGLLIVNMSDVLEKQAHAEMVVTANNFSIMTAKTKDNEEALFVMNNVTNRLLIYKLNVSRQQLELVGNEDIGARMNINQGPGGGAGGGGTGRGR